MFVLVYVVTYEVSKDYSLALLYTALWFAVGKDYANELSPPQPNPDWKEKFEANVLKCF